MSMINPGTYEFNSIHDVMDFVKPLLVEGYSVAINTVYKNIPFGIENCIDKFEVNVGKKGCKMAIYDPDEKAEAVDECRLPHN